MKISLMPKEIPQNYSNKNEVLPSEGFSTLATIEKEKFSAFATRYLREMAKKEPEDTNCRYLKNKAPIMVFSHY